MQVNRVGTRADVTAPSPDACASSESHVLPVGTPLSRRPVDEPAFVRPHLTLLEEDP